MIKKALFIIVFFIILEETRAQQDFVASGGDTFYSSDGTFSYSLGQISNLEIKGNEGIIISNGVQHAYEIYIEEIKIPITVNFNAIAYPNPTNSEITIKILEKNSENLTYHLYDSKGIFITKGKIDNDQATLQLGQYASGVYMLKVTSGNNSYKLFKIIKK